MNKKGEMTTEQIVMIVILIVSFIVILYFFFRLNFGGTTNDEICHNSIVLRSKSAKLIGQLTCKTDYVCISGGGSCSNLNTQTTVSANSANEVMKSLADQMANCWYTYGEGNINYLNLNVAQEAVAGGSGCAVCTIVGFDNKVGSINYKDFINYLASTQKDSSQTYLQYLYGFSDAQNFISNQSTLSSLYNSGVIDTNAQYAIITGQITGPFAFWARGKFLPPTLVKTTDISQYVGNWCNGNFITQAS
jgi:hypothetical protein